MPKKSQCYLSLIEYSNNMNRQFLKVLLAVFLCVAVCHVSAAELQVQVNNAAGAPLENAVVYVEIVNAPTQKAVPATEIAQKNKTFVPYVSVIQVGSSVTFPNKDSVRHHVYSFSPAKSFELKLYSGVPAEPILFDKPGTVVLGCNIHDQMLAYVHVVDTPFFAKTDVSGKAKLSNFPQGTVLLKVWHPALKKENVPYEEALTMKETGAVTVKLDVKS